MQLISITFAELWRLYKKPLLIKKVWSEFNLPPCRLFGGDMLEMNQVLNSDPRKNFNSND